MGNTPHIDIKMFKILKMFEERKTYSIELISKELNVTSRSVRNYIKKLNNELGEDVAQLKYLKGEGYKLDIHNHKRLNCIIKENKKANVELNNKEDRILFILKYLVELENVVTLDELAEMIYVGRTTIVNDLKIVKKELKSFGIELTNKQNTGMKLDSNEINIRIFILNFLYKFQNQSFIESSYYKSIENEVEMLKGSLYTLFKENNIYITEEVLLETINYIALMIYRNKENKTINKYDEKYKIIHSYYEYEIGKKIKRLVENTFDFKLNENEIVYLTLPLISGNAPNVKLSTSYGTNPVINSLVEKMFKEIYTKTGIYIEDEELKYELGYHLKYTLNRLLFNMKIKNIMLDEIKENYILPYNMATIGAKVIQDEFNVEVSEDEMGYIAIHFGGYLERSDNKFKKIRKIALVCGTGLGTTRLLMIKLKKMLTEDIEIQTFSSISIQEAKLDQYDMILTTIDINLSTDKSILKIDNIFDEKKLKAQIEKLLYLSDKDIDVFDNSSLLTQLITDTNRFISLNEENMLNAVNIILDELYLLNEVDKKFIEYVISREIKSPTTFGNGLLLPHGTADDIDKIKLVVGALEKPIKYNNKEIKLIVLMIIPSSKEANSDLILKTYDELLKLGQNKKLIDKLSKCKSLKEFKNILVEENL